MKALLWLLALIAAAVALVLYGRVENAFVLIAWPPYRVELSVALFVLLLGAALFLLYWIARLTRGLLSIPEQVRGYRMRRRREKGEQALAAAMQALLEGHPARADKEAARAFELEASPGVAALLAVRANHQLRRFEERDRWYGLALSGGERLRVACAMLRTEIALEERDFAAAAKALAMLRENEAREPAALRLALRVERGAGHWENVHRMAAQLAKRDALPPAAIEEIRVQADLELLQAAATDRTALIDRWRRLASTEQQHPRVAEAAARHAHAVGAADLAREIIERALAVEWTASLVGVYGELPSLESAARSAEAQTRIGRAEKWLREHAADATLLATLGRLCVHAELWGKAQSYFEASLSLQQTREAHLDLARLAERLGREADAQGHYRRAAEHA